jgi:hypothetical protein
MDDNLTLTCGALYAFAAMKEEEAAGHPGDDWAAWRDALRAEAVRCRELARKLADLPPATAAAVLRVAS